MLLRKKPHQIKIFTPYSEINSIQIQILNFIANNESKLIEIATYKAFHDTFQKAHPEMPIDKYEFKYYSNDLETKVLISLSGGLVDYDSKANPMEFQDSVDPSVNLTSLGQKFVSYLLA